MMNTFEYIVSASAIAAAIGIAYPYLIRGRRAGQAEIITFYQKERDAYKDMMEKKEEKHSEEVKTMATKHAIELKEIHTEMSKLRQEFGIVQGQYNSEKIERQKIELILKDKNPETVKFMEMMVSFATAQGKVNQGVTEALAEILKIITDEKKKEMKIEATITKT